MGQRITYHHDPSTPKKIRRSTFTRLAIVFDFENKRQNAAFCDCQYLKKVTTESIVPTS
jgi:hypothetical protein